MSSLTFTGSPHVLNLASSKTSVDVGDVLMKVSLVLQLVILLVFAAVTTMFHIRCCRSGSWTAEIRTVLIVLYISTNLLFVRTAFRTSQFFQGYHHGDKEINTREVYFWVFDAVLVLLNSGLWNVWPLGKYLSGGSGSCCNVSKSTDVEKGAEEKKTKIDGAKE
jgi:hypothetical protein